ncbi:MAG: hypothetical protein AAF821_15190 [Cyanobacteria bacterium P01_D01_bin.156]
MPQENSQTLITSQFTTTPAAIQNRNPDLEEIQGPPALENIPPGLVPTVLNMAELFGSKLPSDIKYTQAPVTNSKLQPMAFFASYDEGYCGHFTIPGGDGAAAKFEQVVEQENPTAFIKENLNFGEYDNGEWIIFVPGLNTLHTRKPGWEFEQTAPQRLADQYQPILETQMSHLHLGTDMDQGDAVVPLTMEGKALLEQNRSALQAGGLMPDVQGDSAIFNARQRDRVETLLAQKGLARPLFRDHAVKLLQANETAKLPMVWMPYSRGSSELSGALSTYIQSYVSRHPELPQEEAQAQIEEFLRTYLTVVTIGNAIREWPDGPAYVHYSSRSNRPEGGTDPLTNDTGVHIDAPEGAGRDAVFLHADGLFSGFDAHNFGASGAGTLKLIMEMNGFKTYRQLWQQGQIGEIKVPNYQQIAAQVVMTDGGHWIWSNNEAWRGVHLPSYYEAQQILANTFGAESITA